MEPKLPKASAKPEAAPSLEESLTFAKPEPSPAILQTESASVETESKTLLENDKELERDTSLEEPPTFAEPSPPANKKKPVILELERLVEDEPAVSNEKKAANESRKKAEPLVLTLDQLIEESPEDIPDETPTDSEPAEPVAADSTPDPAVEPEPSAVESIPIPEEELEEIDVAVNEEKSDFDTTPFEKINTRAGKAQRLIDRLETFQQKAEQSFKSKRVSPLENERVMSLAASMNTVSPSLNSPDPEDGISPTPTLEELETFLFPARQKN